MNSIFTIYVYLTDCFNIFKVLITDLNIVNTLTHDLCYNICIYTESHFKYAVILLISLDMCTVHSKFLMCSHHFVCIASTIIWLDVWESNPRPNLVLLLADQKPDSCLALRESIMNTTVYCITTELHYISILMITWQGTMCSKLWQGTGFSK